MAFRSSLMRAGKRMISTTKVPIRGVAAATAPKYNPRYARTTSAEENKTSKKGISSASVKGDYAPVYISLGMIAVSASFGLYTAKQELVHAPDVRVRKKRRETLVEIEEPEDVAEEGEKFVRKSLFRKVAQLQEKGMSE